MYTDEYIQISCSAIYGDFPMKFSWLFRNESIVGSENVRIEFTKRSSILSIEAISGDNAGVYTCVVANHAGATNASTELIVKGYAFPHFLTYHLFFYLTYLINLRFISPSSLYLHDSCTKGVSRDNRRESLLH